MLRPAVTIFRKVIFSSFKEYVSSKIWYSTRNHPPRSTSRLTLISASVGLMIGAGYGGYTHYKVNVKKNHIPDETVDYMLLKEAPEYKPHYKVVNENSNNGLELVLFQYRTCPFCCKVRAFLDYHGINYEIVEVDAVLRQAIKWSGYKKVPILLAKVDGGYQQLLDSSVIMSVLQTHLTDKLSELQDIVKYYPHTKYMNDDGKESTDIPNKYYIMHHAEVSDEKLNKEEIEERKWRQWADKVLVHLLSPNVYRTPSEALETFKWFEDVGGWRQNFPTWECALMVYGGAFAMWIISKRLKKRHNIDGDARNYLYKAANDWMKNLKLKGTPFMGGNSPNLADVSVFGILSSIEGCEAFKDLRTNTEIGKWYDATKEVIDTRRGKIYTL